MQSAKMKKKIAGGIGKKMVSFIRQRDKYECSKRPLNCLPHNLVSDKSYNSVPSPVRSRIKYQERIEVEWLRRHSAPSWMKRKTKARPPYHLGYRRFFNNRTRKLATSARILFPVSLQSYEDIYMSSEKNLLPLDFLNRNESTGRWQGIEKTGSRRLKRSSEF